MPLWGNQDQQNNAPRFTTVAVGSNIVTKDITGVGNVATTSSPADTTKITSFNNTTVSAFESLASVGTFGVSATEAAAKHKGVSPGWVNVTVGTGPVTAIAVSNTANTVGFANGETVKISNGTSNGTALVITSNTTGGVGNVVSLSVSNGGAGFPNASVVVLTFNREQHLGSIAVTSNATAIGFNNTDVITASNGSINATATLTTNATGGITATTVTKVGLFANTAANSTVVFTVANSTGGNSSGNVASTGFAANLVTSTNTGTIVFGTVTTGGRSGRVMFENLAFVRIQGDSENTVFSGL
jgi:hypothetical protein